MYQQLCSYENLFLAYKNARRRKTKKRYVKRFERNLYKNLTSLRSELILKSYETKPMQNFIVRDPKTRKISKSAFRDRVVHHAIINVIGKLFEKSFIYDSHANRVGQGTSKALERFDLFKRKVSRNNSRQCFVLKADIKHYFEDIDHEVLVDILKRKIDDGDLLWLIGQVIKANFRGQRERERANKGMPLGNLTSQFFANVYLNELDQFVKHTLRAKYYLRYVDDFVILDNSKERLEEYKVKIKEFLNCRLKIDLHPNKSYIVNLQNGVNFLGFRVFYHHKLAKKSNLKKFERKFNGLKVLYRERKVTREKAVESLEGWMAYASNGDTYKYRKHLVKDFNASFYPRKQDRFVSGRKFYNYIKKVEESNLEFSTQKTLRLYKKGLSIVEIATRRKIKVGTVWSHIIELIEYGPLSVWDVLPKNNIVKVISKIKNKNDLLRDIRGRVKDSSITYDEIACVLAHVRFKDKVRRR